MISQAEKLSKKTVSTHSTCIKSHNESTMYQSVTMYGKISTRVNMSVSCLNKINLKMNEI